MSSCPSDNTQEEDQSSFFSSSGVNWDAHRIGWVIAGATTVVTGFITVFSVGRHAANYRIREEQRQIIRILYMPAVYAIISFFSYRFFRDYTYYSLIEVVYESITLSAFLMLLVQYVASKSNDHSVVAALAKKDKKKLVFPLCCWRYRPTKPAFMHVLKWTVLQYTVIRPAVSIAGIITQYYGVYCSDSWSYKHANVYLEAVDFVSISVALYGLILFYALVKDELAGRKPLAKFLCIKLIVMATFYQEFVFSALQNHGSIHATQYWSATNIADGLNALTTCCEMVLFSLAMLYSYPVSEYKDSARPKLHWTKAIIDSLNYADFAQEIWTSFRFFVDYIRGKPYAHSKKTHGRVDFDEAFGLDGSAEYKMSEQRMTLTGSPDQDLERRRDAHLKNHDRISRADVSYGQAV